MEKKYKNIPNEELLVNEPAIAYGTSTTNENMIKVSHPEKTTMPYCFTEEGTGSVHKEIRKKWLVEDEEVKAFEAKWINVGY